MGLQSPYGEGGGGSFVHEHRSNLPNYFGLSFVQRQCALRWPQIV